MDPKKIPALPLPRIWTSGPNLLIALWLGYLPPSDLPLGLATSPVSHSTWHRGGRRSGQGRWGGRHSPTLTHAHPWRRSPMLTHTHPWRRSPTLTHADVVLTAVTPDVVWHFKSKQRQGLFIVISFKSFFLRLSHCVCGGQKTTFMSWFLPSTTWLWALHSGSLAWQHFTH